ncbi:MAG TPA: PAS domain S-box protein, partial [Thermoanaerobaculia bacterium]
MSRPALPHDLGLENAILRNLLAQTTRAYEEQMTALHAEKDLAETTLASIADAVITTDAEGRVQYLNPVAEGLTGWSTAEAAGQPLDAVFHLVSEASGQRLTVPEPVRPGRRVTLMEPTLLVRRDGQRFAVESTQAPIRDAEGR